MSDQDKKPSNRPIRKVVVKRAAQKPEPRVKQEFEKKVSPNTRALPSHGSRSHKDKDGGPLAKPKDLIPWEAESDKRISEAANREFEAEKNMVHGAPYRVSDLSSVPLAEELSTDLDAVVEYCEREPWRITDINSLSGSPKFGTIPARYDVMAKEARKLAKKADKKDDSEAFSKHIDRAAECEQAGQKARECYLQQIRKDFRVLASRMDRKQIGLYSESMWTRVFLSLKAPNKEYGGKFDGRFFMPDIRDDASKKLQKAASRIAAAHIKWMCLNINEIPMTGYNAPSAAPEEKVVVKPKGPLLN